MLDVYRTLGVPDPPACMHCMTGAWMAFDALWEHWICGVCGICDCDVPDEVLTASAQHKGEGKED